MRDISSSDYTPVTLDECGRVSGPFFHGTRAVLHEGDELVPGHISNFDSARVMNHIYFAALLDAAVWGAELACALAGQDQPGHVYEVEPTGPFEDDPNVTNKKFPGNVTQSFRSRHSLRIARHVLDFPQHDPDVLDSMLQTLRLLREQGRDVIKD